MEVQSLTAPLLPVAARLAAELWPDTTPEKMEAHYQQLLQAANGTCFLLYDGEQHRGFIELSVRHDYVEGATQLPVAYIEGLYVQEQLRHQGLGKLLLEQAAAWAQRKGFTELCSDTEAENIQSIGFHTAAGFTEASRIVCFVKQLN